MEWKHEFTDSITAGPPLPKKEKKRKIQQNFVYVAKN